MEVVLGMPFFTLSNADVRFAEGELTWRSYTAAEAFPITRQVELINRNEFAAAALNENEETFVRHVAALLELTKMTIHLSQKARIASLNVEEATIPSEYSDYANVFSKDSAAELAEHTGIE